ncbi:MAG: DUF2459 domain-containing protein [Balneolaceae bacterium]|nr:DUF2459 domain-containing protein [Balneolaceae bacterium]
MFSPRYLPLLLLFITGCLGPVKDLYPEKEQQRSIPVFVVSHGWHVAIAFSTDHVKDQLPEHKRLPDTKYLMIGWGDNKYYPAEKTRIDLFLRAAFLPTGSVIQVVGVDQPIHRYFTNNDIVRVELSNQGMKTMCSYIAKQFSRSNSGSLEFAIDGLYENSAFFKAEKLYYFPRTSNWWAAHVLRKSGLPITPFYAITAGNVIRQSRKSGELIQQR